MLMEKQAAHALTVLDGFKQDGKLRHRAVMETDMVVVWAMYRGWSKQATAELMGMHRKTVAKRMVFFFEQPPTIFELPVLTRDRSGYLCEFCGSRLKGMSVLKARCHVAEHVVGQEAVRTFGVIDREAKSG